MFPASVLTGVPAVGSRQGAAIGCRAREERSLLAVAAARLSDAAAAADIMESSSS